MRLPSLTWPLLAAVALTACGAGDEMGEAGTPDTTAAGGNGSQILFEGGSGPLRAGEVVARSAAEWEAAWRDHEGPGDPPDVAAVDFGQSLVVGLFAGQRPTGGYRVVPGEVEWEPDGATLAYEVVSPGRGCVTSQVLTAPFTVVRLPAADALGFAAGERTEDCQ